MRDPSGPGLGPSNFLPFLILSCFVFSSSLLVPSSSSPVLPLLFSPSFPLLPLSLSCCCSWLFLDKDGVSFCSPSCPSALQALSSYVFGPTQSPCLFFFFSSFLSLRFVSSRTPPPFFFRYPGNKPKKKIKIKIKREKREEKITRRKNFLSILYISNLPPKKANFYFLNLRIFR